MSSFQVNRQTGFINYFIYQGPSWAILSQTLLKVLVYAVYLHTKDRSLLCLLVT